MGLRDLLSPVVPFAGSNDPEEAFVGAFSAGARRPSRTRDGTFPSNSQTVVSSGKVEEVTRTHPADAELETRTGVVRDPFEEARRGRATCEDPRFRIFLGDLPA